MSVQSKWGTGGANRWGDSDGYRPDTLGETKVFGFPDSLGIVGCEANQ